MKKQDKDKIINNELKEKDFKNALQALMSIPPRKQKTIKKKKNAKKTKK